MDKAICLNMVSQSIRCRHIWDAFCLNGLEEDTCLECPKCRTQTGVWLSWWRNNRHKPAQKMFWVKNYKRPR